MVTGWLWGPHPPSPEMANRIRDDAKGCRKLSPCIRLLGFVAVARYKFKVLKRRYIHVYTYIMYKILSSCPLILLRRRCENLPIFSGEKQLAPFVVDNFIRYIIDNRIKIKAKLREFPAWQCMRVNVRRDYYNYFIN